MALESTDLFIVQRPASEVVYRLAVGDLPSSNVSISEDAPNGAKAGDLYWDTNDATLYIYYVDNGTGYWVPSVPVAGSDSQEDIDGGTY